MAKHKEGVVEDYLVEQVEAAGGLIRKVQWTGRRGCPDRYVSFPVGRCGFVEVKAPGLKPDPHQAREIARLRSAGTLTGVVDSKDAVDHLVAQWRTK